MLSQTKHKKVTHFILVIFFAFSSVYAFATGSVRDTIPLSNVYTGYRIELLDFKIVNKSNDKISGTLTVINSGKYPVTLGAFGFKTNKLKVLFDADLDQNIKDAIISNLINTELSLEPGDIRRNVIIDADLKTYQSGWKSNTTTIAQKSPGIKSPSNDEKKTIDAVKNNVNSTANATLAASTKMQTTTDEKCPDLIISKITVLKNTKSKLVIEYTLTNQGTEVAQIYDKKAKEKEYFTVAAYFSASNKLSRGSVVAGGEIIEKGLEVTGGQLVPGSSYTGKINIDLSSKTRYLNTLILSADSRQVVYECVENNNNGSVLVE
ncbi:MAG TPA: hypothetical protein VK590_02920 [Saprospiraceae bacterium]|nr:hypothetical protein [Saprospiraceae bacterium]